MKLGRPDGLPSGVLAHIVASDDKEGPARVPLGQLLLFGGRIHHHDAVHPSPGGVAHLWEDLPVVRVVGPPDLFGREIEVAGGGEVFRPSDIPSSTKRLSAGRGSRGDRGWMQQRCSH